MAGFGINGIEPSGTATLVLDSHGKGSLGRPRLILQNTV